MRAKFLTDDEAVVVADVIATVAMLRQASAVAVRLRRDADAAKGGAMPDHHRARKAEDYVRELTDRIASRARLGDMDPSEAISLASAVIDGKLRLPDGVEALEAA